MSTRCYPGHPLDQSWDVDAGMLTGEAEAPTLLPSDDADPYGINDQLSNYQGVRQGRSIVARTTFCLEDLKPGVWVILRAGEQPDQWSFNLDGNNVWLGKVSGVVPRCVLGMAAGTRCVGAVLVTTLDMHGSWHPLSW